MYTVKGARETLDSLAENRSNNFDFLRFFAATLVILSHSFPIAGQSFEPFAFLTKYDTFGAFAVEMFFIMSGFLIAKSWADHQRSGAFIGKRVVRIFPALVAATLFGIFVIGFLFTSLSKKQYFTDPQTWYYLYNITLFKTVYALPGVFLTNPLPIAVNGSLWTLPYEFIMYLVVLFFGLVGFLKKKWLMVALVIFLALLQFLLLNQHQYEVFRIDQIVLPWLNNLAVLFLTGTLMFLFRKKIPLDYRLAIFLLAIYLLSFRQPVYPFVKYISLPYLVLFVANMNLGKLRNFGKYGDFSYGMYVYAFPIQQAVASYFPGIGIRGIFAYALPITFMLSFISWHIIEKPSLAYKRYFNKDRYPIIRSDNY